MSVLLLVMSCGRRDYLRRSIEAFEEMVTGPITHMVVHEDSGDLNMMRWVQRTFPDFEIITPGWVGCKSGFAGAIRSAWSHIATMGDYQYVFHLEDDFVFQRPVDLADVIAVLEDNPHLAQMGFRRQPWYDNGEQEVGGWCEKHADEMELRSDADGHEWLVHNRLFTTNPCLYRRSIMKLGWPQGPKSEDRFWSDRVKVYGLPGGVLADDVRCAMWGSMESGARWVEHIGAERAGHTY